MTHTGSFGVVNYAINGVSIGEFGQLALCAMELGVPTILATGEQAFADEAEALAPGVIPVAVKRGLLPDGLDHLDADAYGKAKLSAIHRSPGRARRLIREGAVKAITKRKENPNGFGYIELKSPYVRTVKYRSRGENPPYETREEHPDSIIDLMNMPYQRVG